MGGHSFFCEGNTQLVLPTARTCQDCETAIDIGRFGAGVKLQLGNRALIFANSTESECTLNFISLRADNFASLSALILTIYFFGSLHLVESLTAAFAAKNILHVFVEFTLHDRGQ
jgi:hypothetical protein